jgi:hypothetical protein
MKPLHPELRGPVAPKVALLNFYYRAASWGASQIRRLGPLMGHYGGYQSLRAHGRRGARRVLDGPHVPRSITVEHGAEFMSRPSRTGPIDAAVENAFIEAFNGRLWDECLYVHQFASIADAQVRPKPGASTRTKV